MAALYIYKEDLQIARALINRDEKVTREYYYHDCYPIANVARNLWMRYTS